MNKKIGFIGCGNMGRAMLHGIISSKFTTCNNIMVSSKTEDTVERIKKEYNVNITLDNKEVTKESDILIIAVKPYLYEEVLSEIKDIIEDKIIISIAAGVTLEKIEKICGDNVKIIRTMPNTPALVGEGISAICPNKNVNKNEIEVITEMFNGFGESVEIEEKDFHGFIALCGSSPAYVFMFIEALADGGCKLGIPRNKAYKMASQAVLGSAKMVLDTGKHPAVLKDEVCSPGGTTIEAVIELERLGLKSAVIEAMESCANKSKNM